MERAHQFGSTKRRCGGSLADLAAEGWKIIVHTTRCSEDIEGYLKRAAIPFDDINSNTDYDNYDVKPVATVYWDDRALRYSGDAKRDLTLIREFRTWSGRP